MTNRPVVLLSLTPCEGAIHLPVIETEFVNEMVLLTGCDAVIFTSKQSVAALDRLCKEWRNLKIFSVGEGTSNAIRKTGAEIFYEASAAYGDTLANEIVAQHPKLHYFYPRAETVASDLESILKGSGVRLRSQTLYRTCCRPIDGNLIPQNAAIIFTAPSTVNCFFKQHIWRTDCVAVAIGERTAQTLSAHTPHYISPEPSIERTVEFARSL